MSLISAVAICCDTVIITKTIAKSLLDIADSVMKQYFTSSLRQLGWCAHCMLDTRAITYPLIKSSLMPDLGDFYWLNKNRSPQSTELTEFYWFNNSPNRSFKNKTATEVEMCNCIHCCLYLSGKK